MVKDTNKVLQKLANMSQNGQLIIAYNNTIISIDFHATEELKLDIKEDVVVLNYFSDNHACPVQLRFKISDITEATFYEIGEHEHASFVQVVSLNFSDGSSLEAFEDYI